MMSEWGKKMYSLQCIEHDEFMIRSKILKLCLQGYSDSDLADLIKEADSLEEKCNLIRKELKLPIISDDEEIGELDYVY